MRFQEELPKWEAKGAKPDEQLQNVGFVAGYKPPAAFFNWLFHTIYSCIKELRHLLSEHGDDQNNPHHVTKEQIGLGYVPNVNFTSKIEAMTGTREVYLPVKGWSSSVPFTQTVNVSGITAQDTPVGSPKIPSGAQADVKKAAECIDGFTTSDGSVTFYCNRKRPQTDVTVILKGV